MSGSAAALAAAARGVHASGAEPPAPLRLGIIGCGGIMQLHVSGLVNRREAVSIAWLCDVDPARAERMDRLVTRDFQASPPRRTGRYEEVLEDADVQAVIVATPHHWHAPITLRAIEAGKDVYCEKPISHVYREGRLVIDAARRHGRVVQHGTQMRSSPVTHRAGELLRQGIIGEVRLARAWTAEKRVSQPAVADGGQPAGLDYDRWLGPAPVRPFNRLRFGETWHLFRDYGNGEIGNDGIHDLDMAVWGLGVATLPREITARGGHSLPGDVGEFFNDMNVVYEYADGRLLVYENYPFTDYGMHGFDNGNVFYGTEGYMIFSRRGAFSVFLGPKGTPGPTEGKDLRGQRGYAEHMADFLAAVRSRGETRANPEIAHRSCALVHLGEIAGRTTGRIRFDSREDRIADDEEASRLLSKAYRQPYGLPGSSA